MERHTIEYHSTTSIGISIFIDHTDSYGTILKWADMAMYEAKDAGGNTVRFHDDDD